MHHWLPLFLTVLYPLPRRSGHAWGIPLLVIFRSERRGSLEIVPDRANFGTVAALLFAPIKDRFQIWLDKFFYRDRYDLRQILIDFGRTLGSEVDVDNVLDRIIDRLGRALFIGRSAIFIEDPFDPSRFLPAKTSGLTIPEGADFSFLTPAPGRPHIFFEADLYDLNYFIPCRVKDRVIAYVGLGRTQNGDYLTSEDLELLETVSDYIGIALE